MSNLLALFRFCTSSARALTIFALAALRLVSNRARAFTMLSLLGLLIIAPLVAQGQEAPKTPLLSAVSKDLQ